MTLTTVQPTVLQTESLLEDILAVAPQHTEDTFSGSASDPIEYVDDRVVFNPVGMVPRRPYLFRFLDHWMAVIKSTSDDLDFFYFASSSDDQEK